MNLSSFAKSLHQARLDRAARRAYQAEQARLTELGRQRIAEFRAQGYVVHVSAYTLGRTSLAGIWRLGLVTFPDGAPRPHARAFQSPGSRYGAAPNENAGLTLSACNQCKR